MARPLLSFLPPPLLFLAENGLAIGDVLAKNPLNVFRDGSVFEPRKLADGRLDVFIHACSQSHDSFSFRHARSLALRRLQIISVNVSEIDKRVRLLISYTLWIGKVRSTNEAGPADARTSTRP
jgi:hypothetical protein